MAIVIELPPRSEEELSIEARRAGMTPAEQATLFLHLAVALTGEGPVTPFRGAVRVFLARHLIDPDRVASVCDRLKKLCLEGDTRENVDLLAEAAHCYPSASTSNQQLDALLQNWRSASVHQPAKLESEPTVQDPTRLTPKPERKSILGKYAYLGLSSEDFAREKQLEIDREDRF